VLEQKSLAGGERARENSASGTPAFKFEKQAPDAKSFFQLTQQQHTKTKHVPTTSFFQYTVSMAFPIIPTSRESFVSFLFWHSIVMTAGTPLSRIFTKSWDGKLPISTVMNFLGISQYVMGKTAQETYLKYPPSPKTDRAFGPHALFGFLWIFAAYLHICHARKLQAAAAKRGLALFTTLAFMLHMGCSLNCLIIDQMEHHPLNWVFLFSNITVSSAYFVLGVYAAIKRDVDAHKDAMIICFLYSIEGAGTIRTVGSILHLFNMGPTFCQQVHGGLATACVFPYVQRLIGIRLLTTYYHGVYAKMRGDMDTWKMFKMQAASTISVGLSVILFFCLVDNADEMLEAALSPSEGKSICVFISLFIGVLTLAQPDSPQLRAFVKVQKQTLLPPFLPPILWLKLGKSSCREYHGGRRRSSLRTQQRIY